MPRRAKPRKRPAGTITQTGQTWRVRWREGGRRRSASFPDRETADRVLRRIIGDIAAGRGGLEVERPAAPPLSELAGDWLDRRRGTHRSAADDRGRWRLHLKPRLGHLRPDEVDPALLRRLIEEKLAGGLSSSTVRLLMRLLSTFYSDLVEREIASRNPAKALPRSTRRLIRPAHDPRTTPFLERLAEVRRVFVALPEPVNLAFAIGALAGLRTGEVLALRREHVDLEHRRIHVRESTGGPLKDDHSRVIPIQDSLHPLLTEWHVRTGGAGQVVPPMRGGTRRRCDEHTLGKKLREALAATKLARPGLRWYECTRHTFASQWVIAGGTIEQLRELLGHSTVQVTERYAHLRPDSFGAAERARVAVDLSAPSGRVVPLPSTSGSVGPAWDQDRSTLVEKAG